MRFIGHAADIYHFDPVYSFNRGMSVVVADVDSVGAMFFSKSNRATDHPGDFVGAFARFLVEIVPETREPFLEMINESIGSTSQPGIAEDPPIKLESMDSNMAMAIKFPCIVRVLRVEGKP